MYKHRRTPMLAVARPRPRSFPGALSETRDAVPRSVQKLCSASVCINFIYTPYIVFPYTTTTTTQIIINSTVQICSHTLNPKP